MANDCNKIFNDIEQVFSTLERGIVETLDSNQPKRSALRGLFRLGGSLTKLAYDTTACAIKNTPKTVVAAASIKREIVSAIEEESAAYQKRKKIEALDARIEQLKKVQ